MFLAIQSCIVNMVCVALFISLVLGISAATAQTCTDDSQCAKNECCQILSQFMIVSRRDLPLFATNSPRQGTCHTYRFEGDHCDVFAKPNGYCSCAPGLVCKGEEIFIGTPAPAILKTKRDMRPSRPGYQWEYKCTKV